MSSIYMAIRSARYWTRPTLIIAITLVVASSCLADEQPAGPPDAAAQVKKANEALAGARKWAATVAALPKSDSLVVSVEFIRGKITEKKGGISLQGLTQTPLVDAQALAGFMETAAKRIGSNTKLDEIQAIWMEERENFHKKLGEDGQTDLVVLWWIEFLDAWQKEALRVDPTRFSEALLQAGPIITGILLELETKHIEAALTKGIVTSSGASDSAMGGSVSGYHHHAHLPFLRWQVRRINGMRQLQAELRQGY